MHPTRIFKTPDELEHAWKLYKEDLLVQATDWLKIQYVGKEGQRMTDAMKLPYTMDGFEVFCYNNYGCVEQYFKNKDGYYTEFVPICSHIKKEIRSNQITGGLLGVYNPSITQRLNSLQDNTKTELTGDISVQNPSSISVRIIRNNDEE